MTCAKFLKQGQMKIQNTQLISFQKPVILLFDWCLKVWPALAVIGGVDRGLRMGGRCRSKVSGRNGTLLGTLKEGSLSAKVLWDDSDAIIR